MGSCLARHPSICLDMNSLVITGDKREAHLRARCPGDPSPGFVTASKMWMAGTSARSKASSPRPAMTEMMHLPLPLAGEVRGAERRSNPDATRSSRPLRLLNCTPGLGASHLLEPVVMGPCAPCAIAH